MIKVRLMGTKNDIKWFGKILQRDVYKRQGSFYEYHWQHDELYAVYFGFSCFYVHTGLETWADCGNHYPVSYTHLDVYKRQTHGGAVLPGYPPDFQVSVVAAEILQAHGGQKLRPRQTG